MICLGYNIFEKNKKILDYYKYNNLKKIFIFTPKKFSFVCNIKNTEIINYEDIIEYRYYYKLLQEIDNQTLLIVNECLRTQNRYDLTYNCIRNFLNQTSHQIIFQYLPFIDNIDDFMILFDFDTRSRWKREKFNKQLLVESNIDIMEKNILFNKINIISSKDLEKKYEVIKEKLFNTIGLKDPHTIPRNLYLLSGKEKFKYITNGSFRYNNDVKFICRNNRFKNDMITTYREDKYKNDYVIFEFCHDFINFCDFITLSQQICFDVLSVNLKVENWYFQRYLDWSNRIKNAYTKIR